MTVSRSCCSDSCCAETPAAADSPRPDAVESATRTCCADSCCSEAPAAATASPDSLRDLVREGYTKVAQEGSLGAAGCGCGTGGCCGGLAASDLAATIGYSPSDLASVPDAANMGLSCGNPTAIASLRPGETVLDLGSGGGFDAFVAGPKVGRLGSVIGVDMTPAMISKARRNLDQYRATTGLDNVEFRLGEIEHLPVPDASADVVISNCVLNLSPDKPQVWREIARVLRPGGRVAVSDLALLRTLPDSVRRDLEALVGCIAGAVLVEETRRSMAAAGLTAIALTPKPHYIKAMSSWQDPLYRRIAESLPAGTDPSDYITSLDIAARKQ
jgi:arsenite methyltransferase